MRERRSRPRLATLVADNRFVPEVGAVPFPGYRLVQLRGTGGFATVWEATNPAGGRVALKFMSSRDASSTARELRSLQAIHKLSHPNLLRTAQVWSMPGQIAIAMDLADASLLDLFLLYAEEFGQPVEVGKVCLYLYQAAQALDFLNARRHNLDGRTVGYQHGDIKPNNILLIGDTAFLADYGMATPTTGPNNPCSRQGTLEYAAPEIFQGNLTDTSDQFSLAVTYYLLRSGAFPFPPPPKSPGKSFHRPAPDLSLATVSEQPVLARALSPIPQSRFPTCVEFMKALLDANGLELRRDPARGLVARPVGRTNLLRALQGDHSRG